MPFINLKQVIYNRIKTLTNSIYEYRALSTATFPYIVYNVLSDSKRNDSNGLSEILEIDIWDNKLDSIRLENLVDSIENLFNNYFYSDANLSIKFDKGTRLSIPDEDENIIRRKLRYIVITYFAY